MAGVKKGHFILSGDVDSGKTSKLLSFIESAKLLKIFFSGVVLRPVFSNAKVKYGYDLLILNSGEVSAQIPAFRETEKIGWHKFRKWHLNPAAFKLANEFVFIPCDIFVVDEVGPLELEDKNGFLPLIHKNYPEAPTTLTVVRSTCVKAFCQLLDKAGRRYNVLDKIDGIIS